MVPDDWRVVVPDDWRVVPLALSSREVLLCVVRVVLVVPVFLRVGVVAVVRVVDVLLLEREVELCPVRAVPLLRLVVPSLGFERMEDVLLEVRGLSLICGCSMPGVHVVVGAGAGCCGVRI